MDRAGAVDIGADCQRTVHGNADRGLEVAFVRLLPGLDQLPRAQRFHGQGQRKRQQRRAQEVRPTGHVRLVPTALIGGYVVEGHVPAREIRRLLSEKPDAIGIAVPAMPIGSPGMDGPAYGNRFDPYEVVLVARDGTARVYQSYSAKEIR